ncbi:hypothetical protein [Syntrophus sp. (in: bacteria)]|uniref:hypothetical protein n=1 Tax=Syntrophus sp. (in: bacteria) TaxID=48412 RepID=UPI00345E8998
MVAWPAPYHALQKKQNPMIGNAVELPGRRHEPARRWPGFPDIGLLNGRRRTCVRGRGKSARFWRLFTACLARMQARQSWR